MFLGYNTNGLAHHDPFEAVELLAEIGYRGVAITLDHGTLNPYAAECSTQARRMRDLLQRLEFRSVIETGARYLLDPRHKHEPTLLTADPVARSKRVDFLKRAIDLAVFLGSDCVSLWSGILRDDVPFDVALDRLCGGLREVVGHAAQYGVPLGFEPEPGMLIDTMPRFAELVARVNHPFLKLTMDVGHLHCQRELPLADKIGRVGDYLVNVHLEDMRAGVHEHLMFGEGEIDFAPVLKAFLQLNYRGGLYVELSRHSHDGPHAARQAHAFLAGQLHRFET